MSEGGPQPQSLIHFSISNRTVAEVNGLGQVTAKAVGTAFILGTIRAVSEDTGKVIVFSQVRFQGGCWQMLPWDSFITSGPLPLPAIADGHLLRNPSLFPCLWGLPPFWDPCVNATVLVHEASAWSSSPGGDDGLKNPTGLMSPEVAGRIVLHHLKGR